MGKKMPETKRVVIVLSQIPTEDEEEAIVNMAIEENQMTLIDWQITEYLPNDLNIALQDQLEAYRRDAGPEAVYMIIRLVETYG